MDYLREGIGLRAYSQRDPLVEYQREGFDMFSAMMEGIKEESVGYLFNLEVQVEEEPDEDLEDLEDAVEPGPALAQAAAAAHHDHQVSAAQRINAKGLAAPKEPQGLSYSAPSETGDAEVKGRTVSNADDPYAGVSRNAECPCGSGKKYKKCHGAPGGPTGLTTRVNG
jgi:preprotein translocase subunit SecA